MLYPRNTEGATVTSRLSEESTRGGDRAAKSHSTLSTLTLTLNELEALEEFEQSRDMIC